MVELLMSWELWSTDPKLLGIVQSRLLPVTHTLRDGTKYENGRRYETFPVSEFKFLRTARIPRGDEDDMDKDEDDTDDEDRDDTEELTDRNSEDSANDESIPQTIELTQMDLQQCFDDTGSTRIWDRLWKRCSHVERIHLCHVDDIVETLAKGIKQHMPWLHTLDVLRPEGDLPTCLNNAQIELLLRSNFTTNKKSRRC
ncbi:hypothetical protein EDD11_003269 [Mortierella claussenii]|nr:hypothetical protein EDD11_003269 [Mortierella claussenii]